MAATLFCLSIQSLVVKMEKCGNLRAFCFNLSPNYIFGIRRTLVIVNTKVVLRHFDITSSSSFAIGETEIGNVAVFLRMCPNVFL